jgi:hypothetical protein
MATMSPVIREVVRAFDFDAICIHTFSVQTLKLRFSISILYHLFVILSCFCLSGPLYLFHSWTFKYCAFTLSLLYFFFNRSSTDHIDDINILLLRQGHFASALTFANLQIIKIHPLTLMSLSLNHVAKQRWFQYTSSYPPSRVLPMCFQNASKLPVGLFHLRPVLYHSTYQTITPYVETL